MQKSSSSDSHSELPYTAESIAKFLGWIYPNGEPSRRILNALEVLSTAEELEVPDETLRDLITDVEEYKRRLICNA